MAPRLCGRPRVALGLLGALAALLCRWRSQAWAPSPLLGNDAPTRNPEEVANRRGALALAGLAVASSTGEAAQAAGFWSTSRWDGSYRDDENYPCEQCTRTMSAEGGTGSVFGRDKQNGDQWEGFVAYSDKEITLEVKYDEEDEGSKKTFKGKWFSKDGEKGIKWNDGTVWIKQPYKETVSPYETDILQAEQDRARQRAAGKINNKIPYAIR